MKDIPRAGTPQKVKAIYLEQLEATVWRRPRNLNMPFSLWTLQRLADHKVEETGIWIEAETMHIHLIEIRDCAQPPTTQGFFDRYNKIPQCVLSILGAIPTN